MTTAATETVIRTKTGEIVTITRADVAVAALDTPDYTAHGRNDFWVMADIGGRLIPVVTLMRAVLGDRDPHNTNDAEVKFRELGFRIFMTRLYDENGRPVTLPNDRTRGAKP
ncbi:hypothetical protein [Streptomyces sp. TN58]|uniref:hypothetical protein n=1 Tax=Streptomyces sp. TN58 TaxID=234612 RepID=UPI0009509C95|nr:hypothetical protein [Streptomyces sp. TN58]APU38865.1 hypothetical protein BSL84_02890 [Streptomyces sp. TN58]